MLLGHLYLGSVWAVAIPIKEMYQFQLAQTCTKLVLKIAEIFGGRHFQRT